MIRVTINGRPVEAQDGMTVLQAARLAGIEIPTLCDHPALKPNGGCRLCVVEVEGARTLQASCTLPVQEGMRVHTDTPKVCTSRKFVLDMIFSERNHFCMFCQKTGGDCELQNAAYGEEMTHWPIQPNWTPFEVDASSPHFVLDHNRCILCRRCVRACGELVGNYTLDMEYRGARTLVTADYGAPLGDSSCIQCGTCVQVCPTGAFIDRRSAYSGEDALTERIPSVCTGCSLGCGVTLIVRDNQLVRVDGDWAAPNGGLLCEQGRYGSLDAEQPRLTTPMVRKDGGLQPVSWEEAIGAAIAGLTAGGIPPAALASTRLNAEALHAFKRLFGSQLNAAPLACIEEDQMMAAGAALDGDLEALKSADCYLLVGADLARSHPVAGFFVKRRLAEGARLVLVDPAENGLAPLTGLHLRPAPGSDAAVLAGLRAALQGQASAEVQRAAEISGVRAEDLLQAGQALAQAGNVAIVYGKGLTRQSDGQAYRALQDLGAALGGSPRLNLKGKANSLAAHLYGLDTPFAPQAGQAVYVALGDDFATQRLVEGAAGAQFLAVQASYASPLTERADVVLPVGTWAEQGGHFLNVEGRLQEARQAVSAPQDARSNLDVLQMLSGCLGEPGAETAWEEELLRGLRAGELET